MSDLEELKLARQEAVVAQEHCMAILRSKNEWADRAKKAEALILEYQKIIGAECLRLQAGDVLVVRFDPRYEPNNSDEYRDLYRRIGEILPAGVHAFFLLADIGLNVLTDEQLEQAGLMRKAASLYAYTCTDQWGNPHFKHALEREIPKWWEPLYKLSEPPEPACPSVDHQQKLAALLDLPEPACPSSLHDAERPANCRMRLMVEMKPYPKSGCDHCKTGGITGCPYEQGGTS